MIFHYWGKTFLCILPSKLWNFPVWLMGTGINLGLFLNSSHCFLLPLQSLFSQMLIFLIHMHWPVLSWIPEVDPLPASGALITCRFLLFDFCSVTVAALVSLYCEFFFCLSGSLLAPAWTRVSCHTWKCSQGSKLGNQKGHLSLFPISQGSLSFTAWCLLPLKIIVSYTCLVFPLVQVNVPIHSPFILVRSRNLQVIIKFNFVL